MLENVQLNKEVTLGFGMTKKGRERNSGSVTSLATPTSITHTAASTEGTKKVRWAKTVHQFPLDIRYFLFT